MFTVFSTFRSYSMDEYDYRVLTEMLSCIQSDPSFHWLREIPWSRVSFRFCPAITETDSIMGAFSILQPFSIFLRDNPNRVKNLPGGRSFWIEILFPTIIHELRHLWQFKKHPLLFILCAIPGIRSLTTERDAELCRKEAEIFSGNYTASKDREFFEQRRKTCTKENERSV